MTNLENINIPENMEFTRWILTDNGNMPAFEIKLIDQGKLRKIEFYVCAEYDYNDETGLPEETVIPQIMDDEYLDDDDQLERSNEFMNDCVELVSYADDDCEEYAEGSTTIEEAVQNVINYMSKVSAEDEKLAKETNLEIA